jgi:hypothetical protein
MPGRVLAMRRRALGWPRQALGVSRRLAESVPNRSLNGAREGHVGEPADGTEQGGGGDGRASAPEQAPVSHLKEHRWALESDDRSWKANGRSAPRSEVSPVARP